MMKTALMIYRWILISVLLQLVVLSFINFVFLTSRSQVKATSFEVAEEKPKTDVSLKVSRNASNFQVSFNGSYASYVQNDKLVIVNLLNKKEIKTIYASPDALTYYRWLPDRNMVIYSLSTREDNPAGVRIYTYDVDTGVERDYPRISNIPKGSKVVDIEVSPLTNVVYLKMVVGNTRANIYKFNIMNNLSYIMSTSTDSVIKETNCSDKLVYQDGRKKLFVRDGIKNVTWSFPFKKKMSLLEVDSEDRVYVGELDEAGKVVRILYGKLSVEPDKAWSQIMLKRPVIPDNITVTPNGTVYELVESDRCVYNVRNNSQITYKGKFVCILNDYIVSIDNNDEIIISIIKGDDDKLKN